MSETTPVAKPKSIRNAEFALLTWTAWTCFYGIYDSWVEIPQAEKMIHDQTQGMITLPFSMQGLMESSAGYYALIAVVSLWFIYKIGQGKHWARTSFLWGFVCEVIGSAIWMAMAVFSGTPPSAMDWISYIPDLGLQAYALALLFDVSAESWFARPVRQTKSPAP